MSEDSSETKAGVAPAKDYARQLGVVESLVAITNECQSAPVRSVASRALEAIKDRSPGVMREQVYFVLTALQGWRGERATQIHRSLSAYYENSEHESSNPQSTKPEGDPDKK